MAISFDLPDRALEDPRISTTLARLFLALAAARAPALGPLASWQTFTETLGVPRDDPYAWTPTPPSPLPAEHPYAWLVAGLAPAWLGPTPAEAATQRAAAPARSGVILGPAAVSQAAVSQAAVSQAAVSQAAVSQAAVSQAAVSQAEAPHNKASGQVARVGPNTAAPVRPADLPRPTLTEAQVVAFVQSMAPSSQRFLQILQRRKVVRLSEFMQWLALATPKAVAGIAGAIARTATLRGLPVPFAPDTIRSERVWRWALTIAPDLGDPLLPVMAAVELEMSREMQDRTEGSATTPPRGHPEDEDEPLNVGPIIRTPRQESVATPAGIVVPSPRLAQPAPPMATSPTVVPQRATPGRAARIRPAARKVTEVREIPTVVLARGRAPARALPRPLVPDQPKVAPLAPAEAARARSTAEAIAESLSDQQRRLLGLVEGHSPVTVRALCDHLQLSKALHLTELVRTVEDRAAALGLSVPWTTVFDASGEKTFYWGQREPAESSVTPASTSEVVSPSSAQAAHSEPSAAAPPLAEAPGAAPPAAAPRAGGRPNVRRRSRPIQ